MVRTWSSETIKLRGIIPLCKFLLLSALCFDITFCSVIGTKIFGTLES